MCDLLHMTEIINFKQMDMTGFWGGEMDGSSCFVFCFFPNELTKYGRSNLSFQSFTLSVIDLQHNFWLKHGVYTECLTFASCEGIVVLLWAGVDLAVSSESQTHFI